MPFCVPCTCTNRRYSTPLCKVSIPIAGPRFRAELQFVARQTGVGTAWSNFSATVAGDIAIGRGRRHEHAADNLSEHMRTQIDLKWTYCLIWTSSRSNSSSNIVVVLVDYVVYNGGWWLQQQMTLQNHYEQTKGCHILSWVVCFTY